MNFKVSQIYYHIAYWLLVFVILTLIFGRSWGNNQAAFYFIVMLIPIIAGTFYFFNYVLVPTYLLTEQHFKFGLYTVYTIIASLYLEAIVLMFSFIYLGNFSFAKLGPKASDTLLLALVLYFLVILGSLYLLSYHLKENRSTLNNLLEEKEKRNQEFLEIMSNRKMFKIKFADILYIESLSDYIKIHTANTEIVSKERISKMESILPIPFLRIHRSYIVNTDFIESFTNAKVSIKNTDLNIGRSYKQKVLNQLQA